MKNLINFFALAFVLILSGASQLQAQKLAKGDAVIQGGIGLGNATTAYTTSETPYLMVSYEQGIKDNFGKGNLSVGGTIGYKSGRYSFLDSGWNYSYMVFAGRASWHPHFVKSQKLDAYTGLTLGLDIISANATSGEYSADISGAGLALGVHLGVRYDISENWGAWAELGYGFGILNVGVAYKL